MNLPVSKINVMTAALAMFCACGDVLAAGPKIKELWVDEQAEVLHIIGTFDDKSPATVYVLGVDTPVVPEDFVNFIFAGSFLKTGLEDHLLNEPATSVTKKEILCPLPAAGNPSAGWVVVSQNDRDSNPRALTEWRGTVQYLATRGDGPLSVAVNFSIHFRTDVSGSHSFPIFAANDSSGILTAGGSDMTTGESWSGSFPLMLVTTDPLTGVGPVPGANQFRFIVLVNPHNVPATAPSLTQTKRFLSYYVWRMDFDAVFQFDDSDGPINGTSSQIRLSTQLATGIDGAMQALVTPNCSLVVRPGIDGLGIVSGTGFVNGDSAQPVETELLLPIDGIHAQFYQN